MGNRRWPHFRTCQRKNDAKTVRYQRRKLSLASANFPYTECSDTHIEKWTRCLKASAAQNTAVIGGDCNAQLGNSSGQGCDNFRKYVSTDESKRGASLKLMHRDHIAVNTIFRKSEHKQYIFRTATGKKKQQDYPLVHRRNMRNWTDAESNDSIDSGRTRKGSEQRCRKLRQRYQKMIRDTFNMVIVQDEQEQMRREGRPVQKPRLRGFRENFQTTDRMFT